MARFVRIYIVRNKIDIDNEVTNRRSGDEDKIE